MFLCNVRVLPRASLTWSFLELFKMSTNERNQYDKAFAKLSPNGSAITPTKAAKTLSKSGLPREALKRIWEMADVQR